MNLQTEYTVSFIFLNVFSSMTHEYFQETRNKFKYQKHKTVHVCLLYSSDKFHARTVFFKCSAFYLPIVKTFPNLPPG